MEPREAQVALGGEAIRRMEPGGVRSLKGGVELEGRGRLEGGIGKGVGRRVGKEGVGLGERRIVLAGATMRLEVLG